VDLRNAARSDDRSTQTLCPHGSPVAADTCERHALGTFHEAIREDGMLNVKQSGS
jgi:hypothetical protein